MNSKKVAVFTTGGTISSVFDEKSNKIRLSLSGEELINQIKPHFSDVEIQLHEFSKIPGPFFTPEMGVDLSRRITDELKNEDVCGAVIVQGTDTIDEMSYLNSLIISSSKPVVFTGAMKSGNEFYVDAKGNLIGSISVVSNEKSKNKGVLVYFDEAINSPRDVEKYHANKMGAFVSPKGALGEYLNGCITYHYEPIIDKSYTVDKLEEKVALIKVCTGMDDLLIRTCTDNNYKGIVLEGFGAGNVPPSICDAIKDAIDNNIVVVIVSRCFDGQAMGVYDYPGGGARLHEMGVISGKSLSGQKARIKLMVLLSISSDIEFIKNNI